MASSIIPLCIISYVLCQMVLLVQSEVYYPLTHVSYDSTQNIIIVSICLLIICK